MPASHDNFVQAYYNVTVKDCGFNNKVIGGSEVGSSVPCNEKLRTIHL